MRTNLTSFRVFLSLLLAVALLVGYGFFDTLQAGRGHRGADNRPTDAPTGVMNQVIDLMDGEVFMQQGTDQAVWVSEVFDTSRFTRIGLKITQPENGGSVNCQTAWRFSPDDSFTLGAPAFAPALRNTFIVFPPGDDTGERRDEIPDLFPNGPFTTFGLVEVAGLQARIECRPSLLVDLGRIDLEPEPPSATISDVKILLRHY